MCILAFAVGKNGLEWARKIWNRVSHHDIKLACTDANKAYNKAIVGSKHIISKEETCLVESFNALLRAHICDLIRKTKCCFKTIKSLKMAMDLLLES